AKAITLKLERSPTSRWRSQAGVRGSLCCRPRLAPYLEEQLDHNTDINAVVGINLIHDVSDLVRGWPADRSHIVSHPLPPTHLSEVRSLSIADARRIGEPRQWHKPTPDHRNEEITSISPVQSFGKVDM